MSEITDHLREIVAEASKLGIDLESNMNSAASHEQIATGAKELPFDLPPAILELYLWKNGVRLEGQRPEIRMFPRFYFLPFQKSIETTRILIATVGKTHSQWQKSWYGLCADLAGDYYAVNVAPGEEAFGRIFSVQEEVEPFPAFWSFETMLLSILECYKEGAYYLDDSGFLDENDEISDQIYRQFNKGLSPNQDSI